MQRSFYLWVLLVLFVLLLSDEVSAKIHGNPAKEMMALINKNRTSLKLPKLQDNPGLGCMSLQLLLQCSSNCTKNNTLQCNPQETDITEIFAPNCGVELATVYPLTGRLIACNWNYLGPEEALGKIIISEKNGSGILRDKGSLEAGVAFREAGHAGPYFWGILFSEGRENESFVLDGGMGIEQKEGCFSGGDLVCNLGVNKVGWGFRGVLVTVFSCFFVLFLADFWGNLGI